MSTIKQQVTNLNRLIRNQRFAVTKAFKMGKPKRAVKAQEAALQRLLDTKSILLSLQLVQTVATKGRLKQTLRDTLHESLSTADATEAVWKVLRQYSLIFGVV